MGMLYNLPRRPFVVRPGRMVGLKMCKISLLGKICRDQTVRAIFDVPEVRFACEPILTELQREI